MFWWSQFTKKVGFQSLDVLINICNGSYQHHHITLILSRRHVNFSQSNRKQTSERKRKRPLYTTRLFMFLHIFFGFSHHFYSQSKQWKMLTLDVKMMQKCENPKISSKFCIVYNSPKWEKKNVRKKQQHEKNDIDKMDRQTKWIKIYQWQRKELFEYFAIKSNKERNK